MKEQLLKKIKDHSITVGVVGLGYVGLPLAVEKAKAGFSTVGFDVNLEKIEMVNRGHNYIGDVVNADLSKLVQERILSASSDFSEIRNVDFIAICVPTPLDIHQEPDTSYIEQASHMIAKYLKKGAIVVLESTTYPGTTEGLLKEILEKESGLRCESDFYLGFSPERVDPGNLIYKTKNTPKVVGGIGKDATEVISAMYREVLESDVHEVSSPAVAEMEKILENSYRNVNIGLINELARLCHEMGISVWEVIESAKSKPYGFQAFYPGPGLGGHCIPLDPYYLSWKAREYGFHTTLIESSMIINDGQPAYCVERAMQILNRQKKAINGALILQLGMAYKQDIDDYRVSPAVKVYRELKKVGAIVSYFDPWIPCIETEWGEKIRSIPELTSDVLAQFDLVMITCAHTTIDYELVQRSAQMVFDTKNAMKGVVCRDNIEVL